MSNTNYNQFNVYNFPHLNSLNVFNIPPPSASPPSPPSANTPPSALNPIDAAYRLQQFAYQSQGQAQAAVERSIEIHANYQQQLAQSGYVSSYYLSQMSSYNSIAQQSNTARGFADFGGNLFGTVGTGMVATGNPAGYGVMAVGGLVNLGVNMWAAHTEAQARADLARAQVSDRAFLTAAMLSNVTGTPFGGYEASIMNYQANGMSPEILTQKYGVQLNAALGGYGFNPSLSAALLHGTANSQFPQGIPAQMEALTGLIQNMASISPSNLGRTSEWLESHTVKGKKDIILSEAEARSIDERSSPDVWSPFGGRTPKSGVEGGRITPDGKFYYTVEGTEHYKTTLNTKMFKAGAFDDAKFVFNAEELRQRMNTGTEEDASKIYELMQKSGVGEENLSTAARYMREREERSLNTAVKMSRLGGHLARGDYFLSDFAQAETALNASESHWQGVYMGAGSDDRSRLTAQEELRKIYESRRMAIEGELTPFRNVGIKIGAESEMARQRSEYYGSREDISASVRAEYRGAKNTVNMLEYQQNLMSQHQAAFRPEEREAIDAELLKAKQRMTIALEEGARQTYNYTQSAINLAQKAATATLAIAQLTDAGGSVAVRAATATGAIGADEARTARMEIERRLGNGETLDAMNRTQSGRELLNNYVHGSYDDIASQHTAASLPTSVALRSEGSALGFQAQVLQSVPGAYGSVRQAFYGIMQNTQAQIAEISARRDSQRAEHGGSLSPEVELNYQNQLQGLGAQHLAAYNQLSYGWENRLMSAAVNAPRSMSLAAPFLSYRAAVGAGVRHPAMGGAGHNEYDTPLIMAMAMGHSWAGATGTPQGMMTTALTGASPIAGGSVGGVSSSQGSSDGLLAQILKVLSNIDRKGSMIQNDTTRPAKSMQPLPRSMGNH